MSDLLYTPDNGLSWTSQIPQFINWKDALYETRVVVEAGDWQALVDAGIYRTWVETGDAWLGYDEWSIVPNPEPEDNIDVAARYLRGTTEERETAHRKALMDQIDSQVANPTGRELAEDPFAFRKVESTSGGASERKSDLEDYSGDLYAFDTAIVPTPADGGGATEAKMTTFIDRVEPWAGAPNDDLALVCVLEIITAGAEAEGAQARAHMFGPKDGPAGAVMTFTQDATNPAIWRSQSQLGRYWQDEQQEASMRLLWDSGSLPVAETKLLRGYGDRQSAVVRSGLP